MTKITAKTTLEKILNKKGAGDVLLKNNVPCMSCPYSSLEIDKLQIGEVCKTYKLDLKKILNELNKK